MNRKTVMWRPLFILTLAFLLLMPTWSAAAEADVPSSDAAESDTPSFDAVETDAPSSDAAETDAPSSDAAETVMPSSSTVEYDVPLSAVHVATADELHNAMAVNAAYIAVDTDLDLGTWNSISEFSGTLDGQGHTLTITGFSQRNEKWGFVFTNSGTIRNICFNVNVKQIYSYENDILHGGVIAHSNEGTIESCSTTGSLGFTCLDTMYSFAGFVETNEKSGVIQDCYSTIGLHIVSDWGWQQGGASYGFMGENLGMVERCWSTASKASTNKGAYFCSSNRGTMNDCFTNIRYNGDSSSVNVVGTTELKQRRTYPTWHFGNVWYINPGINDGYPVLRVDQRWTNWLDEPKICELALDKSTVTIGTGESCQLTATMTPGPLDVQDSTLEWSSSNPSAASVTQNGLVRGLATGAEPVMITVRSAADPTVSASCNLQIERSADALKLEDLTLERGASGGAQTDRLSR